MLCRLHLHNLDIVFGWDRPDVVKEVADFERGVPQPVAVPQLDGPDRCVVAIQALRLRQLLGSLLFCAWGQLLKAAQSCRHPCVWASLNS